MKKLLLFSALLITSSLYSQIENGMIAHFPFDNALNDLSNSYISCTNNGSIFANDRNGVPSYAVEFNGGTEYIAFNDNDVKVSFPISISFWINLNSMNTSSTNPIFFSDNEYNVYYGYFVTIGPDGKPAFHMGDGNGYGAQYRRSYHSDDTLLVGNWYHVVGIMRSYNDMDIYIDCNQTTGYYTGTGDTTIIYSSNESRIGGYIGNQDHPSGIFSDLKLDQFVIWDRELTPNEIAFLCDTNNPLEINELKNQDDKEVVKIVDLLGRETAFKPNTPLIYIYSDGTMERVFKINE